MHIRADQRNAASTPIPGSRVRKAGPGCHLYNLPWLYHTADDTDLHCLAKVLAVQTLRNRLIVSTSSTILRACQAENIHDGGSVLP